MDNDKEVVAENDKKLPPLSPKLVQTLMAMIQYPIDQEAIAHCPYSERQFYRVKPLLEKYRTAFLESQVDEARDMLRSAKKQAALEFIEQMKHRDVNVRFRAANSVWEKTETPDTGAKIQVNVQNVIDKQKESYKLDE